MALRFELYGVFDLVERLAAIAAMTIVYSQSTKREAMDALRRVLDYCEQHPSRMWCHDIAVPLCRLLQWYQDTWDINPDRTQNKSGQRSERLLKICIEFDAKAESLLALNYLAAEFNKEHIRPGLCLFC